MSYTGEKVVREKKLKKIFGKYDPTFFNKDYFVGEKANYLENFWDYEKRKEKLKLCVRLYSEVFKKIYGVIPRKVLDIGCGLGIIVKAFNENGIEAHGIDISDYAVENALHPNVKKADIREKLPFPDDEFDIVFMFDVIEHIPPEHHKQLFKEIRRIKRGLFVLLSPFFCHPLLQKDWHPDPNKRMSTDPSHIAIFPIQYYQYELAQLGMKCILSQNCGDMWDWRLIFK